MTDDVDFTYDQYAAGGCFGQVSDAAGGDEVTFNQYAAGGPWEQLRVLIDTELTWNQYSAGGVLGQAEVAVESEGGGAPEWVPDGAVAFIDAVNEHYWDGSETTLAAMISGITRDGDGLFTASGGFDAIGAFLAVLVAWPMTIVVSANDKNVSGLQYETADPLAYAALGMHNANATTDDFDSAFLQVIGVDATANQKTAATMSAAKFAISVEGASVIVDDSQTLTMPTFTAVKVAGFGDDTGRITEIAIYPAQLDAALPALSTV